MKLAGAEASRYFGKPDRLRAGLLIYGADPMRVALKRAEFVVALIGKTGEAEMRLTRMSGADLRKDGTLLLDAIKAIGFFPGPRLVFVEDATDTITGTVAAALQDWQPGDANILITAGALTAKSALKTLFEKHLNATAIALYDDPPTREEVEAELGRAGLTNVDRDATTEIFALSRSLDPGDFRQTLEKLALYKHADPTPLTAAEVHALAPATADADVLDLVHAAVEGKAADLGLILRRLEGQGTLPVTLCIQTLRYIRALHATATTPDAGGYGGRAAGFGPRRAAMERQAKTWGGRALESAMALLVETDLTLRSTSKAPAMALMERALIRIAMMRRG